VVLLALVLASCSEKPKPLPVFNTVPDFVLTAQTGHEFRKQFLDGKIWVADFIFTTCPGPCPRMTAQMRQIGAEVKDLPQVDLVSFTVDPKTDTPAVLSEYAGRFKAETDRWHFLTGPQETLHLMMRSAFMLGDVNGALTHSTRFVLVDAHSRVRGYYETTDPEALKRLVADIRRLARGNS
jgi:protein SCO1/2